MITNKCQHPEDMACQDGICPDCNYYEYQLWMEAHAHCDYDTWDCPDPEDCPHNKHLVDLPPNNIIVDMEGNQ